MDYFYVLELLQWLSSFTMYNGEMILRKKKKKKKKVLILLPGERTDAVQASPDQAQHCSVRLLYQLTTETTFKKHVQFCFHVLLQLGNTCNSPEEPDHN